MAYYTVVFEDFNKTDRAYPSLKLFKGLDTARKFACKELISGMHGKNSLAGIYKVDNARTPWTEVPPKKFRVGEVHRWTGGKFMYYHERPVKYRKAWVDWETGKIGKGMW